MISSIQSIVSYAVQSLSMVTSCLSNANDPTNPRQDPYEEYKDQDNDEPLLCVDIFYGTQSGTSEDFASQLCDKLKKVKISSEIHDLEDFSEDIIMNCKLGLFLMSTYGDGEPTDNAIRFCNWLKDDDLAPGALSSLNYSVFGLGDRAYRKFCETGKQTDKLLERKGGKRIYKFCEGDAGGDIELDFHSWCDGLIEVLKGLINPDECKDNGINNNNTSNASQFEYKFELITGPFNSQVPNSGYDNRVKNYIHSADFQLIRNIELCEGKCQKSIHHLEFTSKTGLDYQTGDTLYLYAKNDEETVREIAEKLDFDLHFVVTLLPKISTLPLLFPPSTTLKELLQYYYDLSSPIKQSFLRILIPYITDSEEKSEIQNVCNDKELHKKLFGLKKLKLLDFIQLYPSFKIPLHDFLEIFPFITPRAYTISNHNLSNPSCINLTIGLYKEQLTKDKEYVGFCSGYILHSVPGTIIKGYIHHNNYELYKSINNPIIMISVGTGISLMRCILQERSYFKKNMNKEIGECLFYYGCRRSDEDFIYRDELMEYEKQKIITHLNCAFSRETDKKVYVQNKVDEDCEMIWKVLNGNSKCRIAICGSTDMGNAIYQSLVNCVETCGNMNHDEAERYILKLKEEKRYITELWSA